MHFVLERAQMRPELKPTPRLIGLKMYTLELQGASKRNIIFKDTFHYLMCPLSTLPKTFGLSVQDKGFFPHLFTTRENLDRQLTNMPDQRFYQPEFMKVGERQKFEDWYAQQRSIDQQLDGSTVRFHLRQKLLEYCSNDVRILTEAALKFRQVFMDKTGLDVFAAASTCAGLAMNTYRALFLRPNTMTHTPEGGARRGYNASAIATKYIRLFERQHPELGPIQTVEWAVGEKKHPDDSHKRIDGYVERPGDRPLAIEFLGWLGLLNYFWTLSIVAKLTFSDRDL